MDVDVRVIAATNRDLRDKSPFREDLYHRLNNLRIEIPPLRERKEDTVELAALFLQRFCRKYNVDKKLTNQAKEALLNYSWPGNVRELRQSIERATFLSRGSAIDVNDLNLPPKHKASVSITNRADVKIDFPDEGIALNDIEKNVIVQALISSGGNVSETARMLRIGREALRYRIKKYSISKLVKVIG